jgi:predicted small integral membrane protein
MTETPTPTDTATAARPGPREKRPRPRGFLPFDTNGFDRFFVAVVVLIAMHLLWLRFVEPLGLSLWICFVLSLILGVYIFLKG